MGLVINIGRKGSSLFQAIASICDNISPIMYEIHWLLVKNSIKSPCNSVY